MDVTLTASGVLTGGPPPTGIAGTPSVEQDWTLDATGNWSNFTTKAGATTDLNQTRTANIVNEITNITETTGPTWLAPAYDAAGNMTTMPQVVDPTQSLTGSYDAWNRMVGINTGMTPVGKYQYDGRGFRIVKGTYTSGILSETRHFFFTAGWQDIEERVGTATGMDKQYVWGIRYIDELVCRDDPTYGRLYATQDANFNLTGVCNSSSGTVLERYLFDPYGNRTIMNASWTVIGASVYSWVDGPWALSIDSESGMVDNRHRLLVMGLAVYSSRDPVGYSPGNNLYAGYLGMLGQLDPYGLQTTVPSTGPTSRPTSQPTTSPYKGYSQQTWQQDSCQCRSNFFPNAPALPTKGCTTLADAGKVVTSVAKGECFNGNAPTDSCLDVPCSITFYFECQEDQINPMPGVMSWVFAGIEDSCQNSIVVCAGSTYSTG